MRQKMTFLILPVGLQCNLACKYCYHDPVSRKLKKFEIMSDEILKRIIMKAPDFASDIDFLWHGGEPMLAGIRHFQKAIDFQQHFFSTRTEPVGRVRNVVQSNLTLLTENLCRFFAENKFILSTSLDGSREAHDANRIFANGSGTYERVKKSILMWRKLNNPIGAVSLVTKANVKHPAQSFKKLKKAGITSCNFHFCAQNEDESVSNIPSRKETLEFFKKVFDLWMKDDNPTFPIRNFRNVLRTFCGGKPLDCHSNTDGCYGFIAITANGDVYPCHRYVERKEFRIGNVLEASLLDIYSNSVSLYQRMCSIGKKCHECKWLGVCGNGCAYERLITGGSFESTDPECSIKKNMFQYIQNKAGYLFA